jgi:hypothetical protein
MQAVLTHQADQAAQQSGFCQRHSPLGGAAFTQGLVLGCLGHPLPTLADFAQAAAAAGHSVQPQAFDQRLTPQGAACLRLVLADAIGHVVASQPAAGPLLQRFDAVYIDDSTTVRLPDALEELWRGCGGSTADGTRSAIKFQVRLDLRAGTLTGPFLQDGRAADQRSPLAGDDLPPGALRIADLGYFDLDGLAGIARGGAYFLSRLKQNTALFLAAGRLDLVAFLAKHQGDTLDVPVRAGSRQQLPCRLVALRVPQAVAQKRHERLRKQAQKKGRPVSTVSLTLCAWTLYLTNVPVALASAAEVSVLGRLRWQIELLFKLWKADGGLGRSRSRKPYRVLCEVYATLIAQVVQHWLVVAGCWQQPARSLRKAARVVRQQSLALAAALAERVALEVVIQVIVLCLAVGTRIHKSVKDPRAHQLLENLSYSGMPGPTQKRSHSGVPKS